MATQTKASAEPKVRDDAALSNGKGSSLSITARITIWYTVFLLAISLVLMGVIFHLNSERSRLSAENKLVQSVNDVSEAVLSGNADFLTDERVRYYFNDVYISMHDANNDMVAGRLPDAINEFPSISPESIQTVKDETGDRWFIYDKMALTDNNAVYIRGLIDSDIEGSDDNYELSIFVIMIPLVILLAGLGGFLITREAFAPVRDIIETTDEIRKDGNLSRRIPLGKTRDEIYELSSSFNGMFDSIEDMVSREKRFTSDVSHELRTPISVIQAQSEFAMEDPEYGQEAAEVINRESHKMGRLIQNLLTISRSDAGRMTPEIELVNVCDLLAGLESIKGPFAEEMGSKLEFAVPEQLEINTDEGMLLHIISNLVDNAIKYGSHENGIIRVTAFKEGDELICRVSDNGEGIKPDDREKVWERFYQADSSRSNENSSGLGLSIVTAMAKSLGAKATLLSDEASELGGATFEVRVPDAKEKAKDKNQVDGK